MKYTPRLYAQAYWAGVIEHKSGELEKITRNFWQMVWRHKHFAWRYQILSEVEKLWLEKHNLTEVEVAIARPLAVSAIKHLQKALVELVGQEVVIKIAIKPHLLGGAVVTVGDTRYDASLKGRLDSLYNHLVGSNS